MTTQIQTTSTGTLAFAALPPCNTNSERATERTNNRAEHAHPHHVASHGAFKAILWNSQRRVTLISQSRSAPFVVFIRSPIVKFAQSKPPLIRNTLLSNLPVHDDGLPGWDGRQTSSSFETSPRSSSSRGAARILARSDNRSDPTTRSSRRASTGIKSQTPPPTLTQSQSDLLDDSMAYLFLSKVERKRTIRIYDTDDQVSWTIRDPVDCRYLLLDG